MNKLYIIGNGFDLAHGLKTKYSDFLLWLINKTVRSYQTLPSNRYEDNLIVLDSGGYAVREFDSLESFKHNKGGASFRGKNPFFDRLLGQVGDSNWVDIEYEYYLSLIEIYKKFERHNTRRNSSYEKEVKELNECFELLKNQLIEYLQTIKISATDSRITTHFHRELLGTYVDSALFLVFNYTDTIELYSKDIGKPHSINYIHGQLQNNANPIIFGYGDEMDEYYSKIEDLNNNEFLKNIKSFGYFKTYNYRNLDAFLNADYFVVSIMGHSCGLSDRVLLNSIFCHAFCSEIRIYYYNKSTTENDYTEKTQEISRHFPPHEKIKMRTLILPPEKSFPLT
jgi:hypothetical protein